MTDKKATQKNRGKALSVAELKIAGQQRDLERQQRGELTGVEVAAGMVAIGRRAKVLKY